jgi:uncharacterized membrane protein YqaE (UPF0057 family)
MRWSRKKPETRGTESKERTGVWPREVWMRYVLAILLPPLAVFKCRRPTQTALNVALTLCFYLPGMAHAALMVYDHQEEQRARSVTDAIRAWQKRAAV